MRSLQDSRSKRWRWNLFGDAAVRPAWMFRLINLTRHLGFDLVVLVPAALVGWWWATGPGGMILPRNANIAGDGLHQWIINHRISAYFPTAVALYPALVMLRAGRRTRTNRMVEATDARTGKRVKTAGSTVTRAPSAGLAVFATVTALGILIFVPGPWIGRFAPSVVAAVWVFITRYLLFALTDERVKTAAGFRPPAAAGLRGRPRKHIRRCATLPYGSSGAATKAREILEAASADVAARGDHAMRAWIHATAIDYELQINALGHAEVLVARNAKDPQLRKRGAILAAEGLFHRTVGDYKAALSSFEATARPGRRPPRLVMTLIGDCQAFLAALEPGAGTGPPPGGRRTWRLVWTRQHAAAFSASLIAVRRAGQRDPRGAFRDALRLQDVVSAMQRPWGFADLSRSEAGQLEVVKTDIQEVTADLMAAQGLFLDAADHYLETGRMLKLRGRRARRAIVEAKGAVNALRAGALDPGREALTLSVLGNSLRSLEYVRGRLTKNNSRFALLDANGTFYTDVFDVLARCVVFHPDRAAELALWLMEETHRTALADALRSAKTVAGDSDLRDTVARYQEAVAHRRVSLEEDGLTIADLHDDSSRLDDGLRTQLQQQYSDTFAKSLVPELVELGPVLARLGGRLAVYYHCRAGSGAWNITVVTVTPEGIGLHRSQVTDLSHDQREISDQRKPGGILAAFASGDANKIADIHRNVDITDPCWRTLSEALIPPGLDTALRTRRDHDPAVLLVVPDGPISLIPFAGLPLSDRSLLVDHAASVMMPNLNLLPDPGHAPGPVRDRERPRRALLDCGPTDFDHEFRSAVAGSGRRWRDHILPETTGNGTSLLERLGTGRSYDLVAVSNHGITSSDAVERAILLSDGDMIRVDEARGIAWPRDVVLHACWAAHVTVSTSDEPIGLPTACLIGGAESVLGGQAPVDNRAVDPSAQVFAHAAVGSLKGSHLALALRDAIQVRRAKSGTDSSVPCEWANLTVWTTRPPWVGSANDGAGRASIEADGRRKLWTTPDPDRAVDADAFIDLRRIPVQDLVGKTDRDPSPRRTLLRWDGSLIAALDAALTVAPRAVLCSLDLRTPFSTSGEAWSALFAEAGVDEIDPADDMLARDAEETAGIADVRTHNGRWFRTTEPLAEAFTAGEKVAYALRESTLRSVHLAYGLLAGQDVALAQRLAVEGRSRAFADLCEAEFGLRFKKPQDLRPPPLRAADPASVPLESDRPVVRRQPVLSGALQNATRAAALSSHSGVIGTLDVVRALHPGAGTGAAIDEQTRDLELRRGAVAEQIGKGDVVAVSRDFQRALESARRLAAFRGATIVEPDDVLEGIRAEKASAGASCAAPGNGRRASLPPAGLPPFKLEPKPILPFLQFLLLGSLYLLWLGLSKLLRIAGGIALILFLAVTIALHDDGNAPPNGQTLLQDARSVLATVQLSNGTYLPATLLGPMNDYYVPPPLSGSVLTKLAQDMKDKAPSSMADWYAYVVLPPPPGASTASARIEYHNVDYPVALSCPASSTDVVCFGAAHIPHGPKPVGFPWNPRGFARAPAAGTQAIVFTQHQSGVLEDVATLSAANTGSGDLGVALDAVAVEPNTLIRPMSPVVVFGNSHQLPILGVTEAAAPGHPARVLPLGAFASYTETMAMSVVGAQANETTYAGINLSTTLRGTPASTTVTITKVTFGGPADFAGLKQNDVIVAIGGRQPTPTVDTKRLIESYRPGDSTTITVLRNGTKMQLRITFGYVPR